MISLKQILLSREGRVGHNTWTPALRYTEIASQAFITSHLIFITGPWKIATMLTLEMRKQAWKVKKYPSPCGQSMSV